jgi:PmbA protein
VETIITQTDASAAEVDRLAGLAEEVVRRARAAGASQAEVYPSVRTRH